MFLFYLRIIIHICPPLVFDVSKVLLIDITDFWDMMLR